MMHILKIIHGYPPYYNAGSEVYSQSICNELSKTHKVSVFTREENPYAPCFSIRKQKENENLTIYFVNNPQGKDGYRHVQMDKNFASLIQKLQPDVAHIGHVNHLSTGIVDVLYQMDIPIIYTLHDFWLMCPRGQFLTRSIGKENNFLLCSGQEDRKCAIHCYEVYFSGKEEQREQEIQYWSNWIHERMQTTKSFIPKVDLFIAPSRYLRNRFIQDFHIPEHKIIYLDYGFPLHYLTPTQKKEKTNFFTFGYIGTNIPAKGVNLLIEAFQHIKQPAELLIWGHKDEQSANALKKMAQHSKNPIQFMGQYINKNLADEVFSKVDCIVVPSIWAENSPLVIHEAQACHIPVITADFGGMKEYVQHQVNGLLFEHRSAKSLQEQMEFAISNPDLMKELGKRGYLYSRDGKVPDIQSHCEALERFYLQIIKKHKKLSIYE
jgi:glycosyltransferase involved in cell wall biosynthesis